MDALTSKSAKDYAYNSRYIGSYFYYNENDDKYVYGLSRQLDTTTEYIIHNVDSGDNLDGLALKYYGRPDLFLVIAEFNGILDPFVNLFDLYNYVRIPSLGSIKWKG